MELEAERRLSLERRAVASNGRRADNEHQLSEDERITAAQFMLGTRQREEAQLRATHLSNHGHGPDEAKARETLAEMIHLQEMIGERDTVVQSAQRGRGRRGRVIDLEPSPNVEPKSARPVFVWLLVLALVLSVLLLTAREMQLV